MELKVKTFSGLTTVELYEILKARAEIFVVEQNCVYQDLDDRDQSSLHIFFEEDGRVKAYLRAFALDDRTVQIGRVLTLHHGTGLGGKTSERRHKTGMGKIRCRQDLYRSPVLCDRLL